MFSRIFISNIWWINCLILLASGLPSCGKQNKYARVAPRELGTQSVSESDNLSSRINSVISQGQTVSSFAKRERAGLGIGLGGIADWSTQYPFLDFMKSAREWEDWQNDKQLPSDILDEHGWVHRLPARATAGTVFFTLDEEDIPLPYKRFVVRWKGKGRITYSVSAEKIEEESKPNRDVIEVFHGNAYLHIEETDPSDYIRDISIVPEKYVALYDSGEIYNPDFVAKIRQFRAIRFMDWMNTNDSEQREWSDRPKVKDAIWSVKGVPVEIMVALVNKVNADPWFNMPHQATDEYIRQFATYVRDNLLSHLIAYVEYSNEVWNFQFQQSQFAIEEAKKLWGDEGTGWVQYLGVRTAQTCDLWKKDVFVGQTKRVHCTMGVFSGWEEMQEYTLDCPNWVAQKNTPCHKHGIDSMAVAGYFSGCLHGSLDDEKSSRRAIEMIRSWTRESDGGLSKAFKQLENGTLFSCNDTIAENAKFYKRAKQKADVRGLQLIAYEGGQHITSNGSDTQDDPVFINLHISMNRDPRMKRAYLKNFENWKAAGGTLFMQFVDIGVPSKWGSWGALEYLHQPTSVKWEAITEMNNGGAWWE